MPNKCLRGEMVDHGTLIQFNRKFNSFRRYMENKWYNSNTWSWEPFRKVVTKIYEYDKEGRVVKETIIEETIPNYRYPPTISISNSGLARWDRL